MNERGPEIDKLLQYAARLGATDLLVEPGKPPVLQVDGVLREADVHPIDAANLAELLTPVLNDVRLQSLRDEGEARFDYTTRLRPIPFAIRVSGRRESLIFAAHRIVAGGTT